MRFLVDAQLPSMLAEWLRKAGHEAQHVQEVNLRDADDAAIRTYASRNKAVVITKDRDFTLTDEVAIQIIWVRTGNISTRALIDRVEATLPQILVYLAGGAKLVELR